MKIQTPAPLRRIIIMLPALAGLAAWPQRGAAGTFFVPAGGNLPSISSLDETGNIVILGGDIALTGYYNLQTNPKPVDFKSDDPAVCRAITTGATARAFQLRESRAWGFDGIIIKGGNLGAGADGGGILVTGGTSATATSMAGNFIIQSATARNGGGLAFMFSPVSITSAVSLVGNYAHGRGGGFYTGSGAVTFAGPMTFKNNASGTYGGGVAAYFQAANLTFDHGARFEGNRSGASGGGVYAAGHVTFNDSAVFTSNTAGTTGGALILNTVGKTLTLAQSATFSLNASGGNGGALHTKGDVYIGGNSAFLDNTAGAASMGGAWYAYTPDGVTTTLTLDASKGDITFKGNLQDGGTPNALTLRATTLANTRTRLVLDTGAGNTIYFYDPIAATSVSATAALVVKGRGAVVFDARDSNNIVATLSVDSGTFQLTQGAGFGNNHNAGGVSVAQGAALSGHGVLRAADFSFAPGALIEVLGGGTLAFLHGNPLAAASGLTLAGSGTIMAGGALSAARIRVGAPDAGAPRKLVFDAGTPLTLEAGGVMDIKLFGGASSDRLVADTLALTPGAAVIRLGGASGTYAVLSLYNTNIYTENDFTFYINGLPPTARHTITGSMNQGFNNGAGSELVVQFNENNLMTAWTGASGGLWKNSATTAGNWTDGAPRPEVYFKNGDSVVFDAASGVRDITIDGDGVIVAGMTVNTAGGTCAFAGPGGITGSLTDTLAGSAFTPTGRLTKTGAGALDFANTGTNTFVAGIEHAGGLISFTAARQIGDGGHGITIAGSATLRPAANGLAFANTLNLNTASATLAVEVAAGHTATYAGVLHGAAGTFAKIGQGALVLTADNTAFGGGVLASGGALLLDDGGLRDVTIGPGATFGGSGSAALIAGAAGSTLQVGLPGTGGTLHAGGLILAPGATLDYTILGGGQSSSLQAGSRTLAGAPGACTLNLSDWFAGTYDLGNIVELSTPAAAAAVTLKGLALNARQTYSLTAAAGSLRLTLNPTANAILVWSGTNAVAATNGLWDTTSENWLGAGPGAARYAFADYDALVFDDRVASPAHRAIALDSGFTASAMTVAGTGSYRFAGAGGVTTDGSGAFGIAGDSRLTKTGAGTLTLANTGGNLFKNGVNLGAPGAPGGILEYDRAAQLNIGPAAAIHFLGDTTLRALADMSASGTLAAAITLANAVTATLDTGANRVALSGVISTAGATGTLAKTGAGTLHLSGNSAAAATLATHVAAGALLLDHGALGGLITIAPGASFGGAGSAPGAEGVRTTAGAAIQVGRASSSGLLHIARLHLAAGSTLTGGGTLAGAAMLTGTSTAFVAAGDTLTLAGANTGSGGLVKTGAGSLVYTRAAALAYAGGTQIDEGLVMLRDITGADAAGLAHAITLNGGWLDLSETGAFDATGAAANDWAGLHIRRGANASAGGVIGANDIVTLGAGASPAALGDGAKTGLFVVVKAGDGTAILTGSNTYKGFTRIDSGTLRITSDHQLGDSSANREIILNGGALQLGGTLASSRQIRLRAPGTVTVDAGATATWTGGIVPDGTTPATFTKTGDGTFFMSHTANAAATVNIDAGHYVTNHPAGAGSRAINIAAPATLEYRHAAATGTAAITATIAGDGTLLLASSTLHLGGAVTVAAIHLTAGSALLAAAPAPAAFVAPATTLHIDASRVFLGAPQTTLGAVTLANGGTLGFAPPDGAAFRKATLAGIAGGGVLLINTHLGAGHADQLTIHGAITGDYRLVISNTGSIKGFTSPVTIIAADDARNATFTPLWQNTGMYHYTLDTRADGPLTLMQITGVGALSMAGQIINATAGALPLGWLSELTSVSQRLGELRLDAARRPRLNSWLRGYGRQHRFNGKVTRFNGHDGEPFDERHLGADIGMDYKFSAAAGTAAAAADIYLGAFLGCGQSERTFDTGARAANNYFAAVNHAESTTDSIYGGAYAAILTPGGWYLDGVLKTNRFDHKLTTRAVTGETMDGQYSTFAVGGSLELGRAIDCGDGWFAEPQTQIAYAILSGRDYTTSTGLPVELRWGATTQARAGLRIGRVHHAAFGGILQAYLKAYYGTQRTTGGQIITHGDRFSPAIEGDHFDCGGGIAWLASRRLQVHLDFETGRTNCYTTPWSLTLGLRYGW